MTEAVDPPNGPEWSFGDRLRKIRRDVAGLSQSEMAALLEVPTPTYGTWEGNRAMPGPRMRQWVAEKLADSYPDTVSVLWMLGDEVLLPRMDSNHQPCGYRPHRGQPTLPPSGFEFFRCGVSHDSIPLSHPLLRDPRHISARTL